MRYKLPKIMQLVSLARIGASHEVDTLCDIIVAALEDLDNESERTDFSYLSNLEEIESKLPPRELPPKV